ncbi:MAG: DNA-binding protein [Clostridiales bacterium]|nr:DNA-binding protein [Clostridiales bacterium]
MIKDVSMTMLFDMYGSFLTEKQSEAVDLYYNEDLSLSEISDHLGITRQGVRDCIKRGEATLLETEHKIGLAKRYNSLSATLDVLKTMTNELNFMVQSNESTALIEKMESMKKTLEGVMNGF